MILGFLLGVATTIICLFIYGACIVANKADEEIKKNK